LARALPTGRHQLRRNSGMKKCSKSNHTTLSEMNITPLLDLAFVLLVIFIITTTPVTTDMPLTLPKAAQRQNEPVTKIHYVTVDAQGQLYLDRKPVDAETLRSDVIDMRSKDNDLNVVIRGDASASYKYVRLALDTLQQCNVAKVRLSTEAYKGK
jgi:biopolymer transport protein ExbD